VLLLKRGSSSSGGGAALWSQPGGGVDFGEEVETAIKRELKEELDINVELFGHMVFDNDIRIEENTQKHWITGHSFARIINGEPKIMEPDKHDDLQWFDLDKIPENTIGYTQKQIRRFKKHIGE